MHTSPATTRTHLKKAVSPMGVFSPSLFTPIKATLNPKLSAHVTHRKDSSLQSPQHKGYVCQ